jgi:glutaconate CoA-transferase, subunit B
MDERKRIDGRRPAMSARSNPEASPEEVQTVVAARRLEQTRSVFIGVGRPSTAAILARMVHNPELVLVYESGTIGAKPFQVPLSIGEGELGETADAIVSVPEMFNYRIGAGRIEVAFLGAAQIDKHANLNSTVIGDYEAPRTRLPGAGGAPEIATGCREVVVIAPHSRRTFVASLDCLTTTAERTTHVITDLGVLEHRDGELTLTQARPAYRSGRDQHGSGVTTRHRRLSSRPSSRRLSAVSTIVVSAGRGCQPSSCLARSLWIVSGAGSSPGASSVVTCSPAGPR